MRRDLPYFKALLAAVQITWLAAYPAAAAVDAALKQEAIAARKAYLAHDYAAAAVEYKAVIARAGSLPGRLQVVLWSNLGAAYREDHKFPQAEQAFKQAIAVAEQTHCEKEPVSSTAMSQYAVLLRRMGKNVDAELMESRARGVVAGAVAAAPPQKPSPGFSSGLPAAQPQASTKDKSGKHITIDIAKMSLEELKKLVNESDNPVAWYALAQKYQMTKDWQNAVATYRTVQQRFPDQFKKMHLHLNLAISLMSAGQAQDAIQELKLAMDDQPDNGDLYLYMHDYLIDTGDIKAAIENDEAFIEKFPNHPRYSTVVNMAQLLKQQNNLAQSQSADKPSRWERIHNWPLRMMPLKVYVQSSSDFQFAPSKSGMSESTPEEIVQKACQGWMQASQGRISFQFVTRPEDSNIEIAFTTDSAAMEYEAAAGVTAWSGRGEAPKARIMLLTVSGSGQSFTREEFLETCLHELGHALGLEHSPNVADVMYPAHREIPITQLTENDAQRILVLYTH